MTDADTDQSPLHGRVTRIVQRAASDLRMAGGGWAVAAADVVLSLPEIGVALAAVPTLAAIRDRHSPVRWREDSEVVVCTAGCGAWPCADRRLVDGLPPDSPTGRTA